MATGKKQSGRFPQHWKKISLFMEIFPVKDVRRPPFAQNALGGGLFYCFFKRSQVS